MLNLNVRLSFRYASYELTPFFVEKPAMRPSAAQLLQNERLELAFKVSETVKM